MSDKTEPWKWGDDKRPADAYDTAPAGTRFLMCGYDAHAREFASGDWVRHSDYASLQDEVKRLKSELADAQENYHLINEMVAKMRNAAKDGKTAE